MHPRFSILLVAAVLAIPTAARAAAKPAAPVEPPPPPPKSSFVIDPKFGKDPFFPASTRLDKLTPQVTNDVIVPPPAAKFPEELRCQGFAALGAKRLVIVNGRTVEAGEKFQFRLGSGIHITVLCVEVRDRSVILEANGISKELHLREGLK